MWIGGSRREMARAGPAVLHGVSDPNPPCQGAGDPGRDRERLHLAEQQTHSWQGLSSPKDINLTHQGNDVYFPFSPAGEQREQLSIQMARTLLERRDR